MGKTSTKPLKRWRVYGIVTGSKFLGEYEAETADQAEDMALRENGSVHLCHQCDAECDDAQIYEVEVVEVEQNGEES